MPSSDPITIPKVLKIVEAIHPVSILDIGAGNGKYGFLFREKLDWDFGRLSRESWMTNIDAVEVESDYITPVHKYVYDKVFDMDWLLLDASPLGKYDLIFMGDVLEHFENWTLALNKARRFSRFTVVVAPNWHGSIAQGDWMGFPHERHRVELSPDLIGGQCIFANSKAFISVFDNSETGIFGRDSLL